MIYMFLDCWWNQSGRRRSTKVQRENSPSTMKGARVEQCQEVPTSYTIHGWYLSTHFCPLLQRDICLQGKLNFEDASSSEIKRWNSWEHRGKKTRVNLAEVWQPSPRSNTHRADFHKGKHREGLVLRLMCRSVPAGRIEMIGLYKSHSTEGTLFPHS